MSEKIFKECFCEIKKIKVCTTASLLNFDNYTEIGTYEIYVDMGNEQNKVYLLTVDKSASGACVSQTRVHCGTVDERHRTVNNEWTDWKVTTGSGGTSSGAPGGYYTPFITQPTPEKMKITFDPSEPAMPRVGDALITLPRGLNGLDGVNGQNGKAPMVDYNGEWCVYSDAEGVGYVTTGVKAQGERGSKFLAVSTEPTKEQSGYSMSRSTILSQANVSEVFVNDVVLYNNNFYAVKSFDNLNGRVVLDDPNNIKGEDGRTPVRGEDYWTPDDINEIKSYVDEAILGGEW